MSQPSVARRSHNCLPCSFYSSTTLQLWTREEPRSSPSRYPESSLLALSVLAATW